MANNVITSTFLWLNVRDFIRGLVVAILSAVTTTIYAATQTIGGFSNINWENVLLVAVNAGLGYLIVNIFSGSKAMIPVSSDTAKAIKEGTAEVKVETK